MQKSFLFDPQLTADRVRTIIQRVENIPAASERLRSVLRRVPDAPAVAQHALIFFSIYDDVEESPEGSMIHKYTERLLNGEYSSIQEFVELLRAELMTM